MAGNTDKVLLCLNAMRLKVKVLVNEIELRRFPYPYRAALAICSDIDETDTLEQHEAVQYFMRKTIGIPFSNSFFPYHDEGKLCLFSGRSPDRSAIIEQIRNGTIDVIHSYGEKKDFSRRDVEPVWEELRRHGCNIQVWVDHKDSKSNVCKYRCHGLGDLPERPEYHTDLTLKSGIRFIWTDRLTNLPGQEVPLSWKSLVTLYDSQHALETLINMAKTAAKIVLSLLGWRKYDFFKSNCLIQKYQLEDSQWVYEFIRFNNHYKGAAVGDTFLDLYYLISSKVLSRLKAVEGYCIVYTHLGKKFAPESPIAEKTVMALQNLKRESNEGHILVRSAPEILNYCIRSRHLNWTFKKQNGTYLIYIQSIDDPLLGHYVPDSQMLKYLTFYIPNEAQTRIILAGDQVQNTQINPADFSGRQSISII
jgi:hypothetical protein